MKYLIDSILRLDHWLENHDFKGYEPRDALASKLNLIAFRNQFIERVFQQIILRCPFHIRPLIGMKPRMSIWAMGFLARGYIKLWKTTGDSNWKKKAFYCLDWLINNKSSEYSGACWGINYNYISRSSKLPKFVPTVVSTSMIGQAFLDGNEAFDDKRYLDVAISSCEFILKDLPHSLHFRQPFLSGSGYNIPPQLLSQNNLPGLSLSSSSLSKFRRARFIVSLSNA